MRVFQFSSCALLFTGLASSGLASLSTPIEAIDVEPCPTADIGGCVPSYSGDDTFILPQTVTVPACETVKAAILCSQDCTAWTDRVDLVLMSPVFGPSNYEVVTIANASYPTLDVLQQYDFLYVDFSDTLAAIGFAWLEATGKTVLEQFLSQASDSKRAVYLSAAPNFIERRMYTLPFGSTLNYVASFFVFENAVINSVCPGIATTGFAQPTATLFGGNQFALGGIAADESSPLVSETVEWSSHPEPGYSTLVQQTISTGNAPSYLLMGSMTLPRWHVPKFEAYHLRYNIFEQVCLLVRDEEMPPCPPSTAPSVRPSFSPTISPSSTPSATPSAAPSLRPTIAPICPGIPRCQAQLFPYWWRNPDNRGVPIFNDEGSSCRQRCIFSNVLVQVLLNGGWECGTC